MRTAIGGALILGAVLVLVGACTPAGKMTHDMAPAIQSATTKADHEALAAHYEQEAKELQAKAAAHQDMARSYERSGGYVSAKSNLIQHCRDLSARYREAANENLALAKQHRELAAEAPK